MATQTPAPKRKRGGSPSPSPSATAPASSTTTTMSGYGLSLLSSVTRSVTKRVRLGYDYALGTTNGDSDPSGGAAASASGGADAGGAVRADAVQIDWGGAADRLDSKPSKDLHFPEKSEIFEY